MTVRDFAEQLKANPQYEIALFDIRDDKLLLFVNRYTDAQSDIPEFFYDKRVMLVKLVG